MNRRKYKIILALVIFGLLNVCPTILHAKQVDKSSEIIYFYSPTCLDCNKLEDYFTNLEGVEIVKYNVVDKDGKGIFNEYCEQYAVPIDDRVAPIVFVGDGFFVGREEIVSKLEENLSKGIGYDYLEQSNSKGFGVDMKLVYSTGAVGVFFVGIINGLNPCSLAMVIFFITILVSNNTKRIRAMTIAFILSKFITFLLLGTVLYRIISTLKIGAIQAVLTIIMIVVISILFIGNLSDFINIKKGNMNKVRLQLPKRIRKLNQSLMTKVGAINNTKYLVVLIFVIGAMVSMTEFLCTGQVYMLSIVTIFQYVSDQSVKAFLYLLIYNVGMIIPLIIVATIINKGKSILDVSEEVVDNTSKIKLINMALLLLLFGIVLFLNVL